MVGIDGALPGVAGPGRYTGATFKWRNSWALNLNGLVGAYICRNFAQ